jgi:16S rRNA (guanine527-N7)-methyltransferase
VNEFPASSDPADVEPAADAPGAPAAPDAPSGPPAPIPAPPTFDAAATEFGLAFEPGEQEQLARYLGHLFAANRRFNLTRITDPEDAWTRHVLDSLSLLPWIQELGATSLIDVGSGGGLPGIPLAIAAPHVSVTLLEATGKKARFLEEVAAALGLDNVTVVGERAETLGHDRARHRERYDIVTSRAVGRLPVLAELTVPFARRGGLILAIKGEQAMAEIDEARAAFATLMARVVDTVRTPTGTVVVMEKTGLTPRMFPRRPGEPKRVPLT